MLHIGHAKAALLNEYFARKHNGTLIFRLDNTNPVLERQSYESQIYNDLSSLGIRPDIRSRSSDYAKQFSSLILRLLQEGNAYVDNTPQDTLKLERMNGIESKCRTNTVEENLRLFKHMNEGSKIGRKCVVRAKMNMKDTNKACRDPVLMRILPVPTNKSSSSNGNEINDPKNYNTTTSLPLHDEEKEEGIEEENQQSKEGEEDKCDDDDDAVSMQWKAFPTYDFCCPVVDSLEGVTHALRTSEYRDRDKQYKWIQQTLGLRPVLLYDYSKICFTRTVLSKRKLAYLVAKKMVSGWDDPRMPTIQGIIRQGLDPAALRDFMIRMGASKAVNFMEWEKLWAINRQHIDSKAPRFWAIDDRYPVRVVLDGGAKEPRNKVVPLHRKFQDLTVGGRSNKTLHFTPIVYIDQRDANESFIGEELTLMSRANIVINNITRRRADNEEREDGDSSVSGSSSSIVTEIRATLNLTGDFKRTKRKIQWLRPRCIGQTNREGEGGGDDDNDDEPAIVQLIMKDYGPLLTKDKIEDGDQIDDFINNDTKQTTAIGDPNLEFIPRNTTIQLERWGFYRVDAIERTITNSSSTRRIKIDLIKIPDGKTKK
mmetsp:Transcript_16279/g.26057  ORF Transcript_16279/g.26057 Transcript_16279/m.26057 type:complete len:597 (-) Transcript_16279:226-2016(-)